MCSQQRQNENRKMVRIPKPFKGLFSKGREGSEAQNGEQHENSMARPAPDGCEQQAIHIWITRARGAIAFAEYVNDTGWVCDAQRVHVNVVCRRVREASDNDQLA